MRRHEMGQPEACTSSQQSGPERKPETRNGTGACGRWMTQVR